MDEVTRVFNLGMPMGAPVHIRRGDNDAYRLNTSTGSYFVKRYIHPPDAELTRQLEVAIAFERRALEAGVDMPGPIDSRTGWIALIHDQFHRVHRWIEPHAEQDVERWLGRTMAQSTSCSRTGAPPSPSCGWARISRVRPGSAGSPPGAMHCPSSWPQPSGWQPSKKSPIW